MHGITRDSSQIEIIRQDNQSKGVAKNAMQQQGLLAKVRHANNTARENFITQPYDETLARDALRSYIQLSVPDKLHDANLTYNGTRARDLIGFIAEQVKAHGTPADKENLLSVSNKLSKFAGCEKSEKQISKQLGELVSKFARRSGEVIINDFMETYCYPAWVKYHENQGIDVKDKATFNEQLNACYPVLNKRLDVMSEPDKPWELLTQNMSMLIDECAAVSKALMRHDFDAPSPPADAQPKKSAPTPEALRTTPNGEKQKYDIHGGAEKGGVVIHVNNSNRNGDITNAPLYSGEKPAAADLWVSWLDTILKSNLSEDKRYDLAKRIIDGYRGYSFIDYIDSVEVLKQEKEIEQPPVIPAFVQQSADKGGMTQITVVKEQSRGVPQPAVDTNLHTDDVDSQETRTRAPASDVSTRESETPAPVAQVQPAPPAPRQSVGELMVSTNDALIPGAPIRQEESSVSSVIDETDGPIPKATRRLGSVNAMSSEPEKLDWQQEIKQKAQALRQQREASVERESDDARESRLGQLSTVQLRAVEGASGNALPQVKAVSIAERIRYFEEMQKSGAETTVARISRPSSSVPDHIYSTIRTRSQWNFNAPKPKSFVINTNDSLVSDAVRRREATNTSMTDKKQAGENVDE